MSLEKRRATGLAQPSAITTTSTRSAFTSVSLTKMGALYVASAVFQAVWLYAVVSQWDIAVRWMQLPVLGWAMAGIWVGMAVCVPYLLLLGIGMVRMSRNPDVLIAQTSADVRKMRTIALLLAIGILADIVMFPLLLGVEDKSALVFFSALMGGRILQANMEGILQYYKL